MARQKDSLDGSGATWSSGFGVLGVERNLVNIRPLRSPSRVAARAATAATALGLLCLTTAAPAIASGSGTGTANASLLGGSLAVTNVAGASTISGTVGNTIAGDLPAVTLQDNTGTGSGWNATVGVSDLTYTGTWAAVGSATALGNTASGPFTDTVDGVTYTVTTGAIALGIGAFTYTSNDANDASGSGSALATTNNAVGTKGLTINFGVQTLASGSQYRIRVGTQSASAMSLNTGAGGAGVTTTSGNTAPTLVNNGSALSGGGVSSSSYGTAVKFVSAAVGNGMGTYVATPGVNVATDATSWAATYSAGLQYSIVSGP